MYKKVFLIIWMAVLWSVFTIQVKATEGTIRGDQAYAWSENLGWLNFGTKDGKVIINNSVFSGYAWSSNYGWINLKPDSGGVIIDCHGNISGSAWVANFGWLDFTGANIDVYGRFHGVAGVASSSAGRINFDCNDCNVTTDWRPPCIPTPTPGPTTPGPQPISSPIPTPTTSYRWRRSSKITSLPEKLFDIKLELIKSNISKASELSIRIYFENFSTVPTLVDLTYIILNNEGKQVWTQKDSLVVTNENTFTEDFKDLKLPDGKYTFVLTTLYNTNVKNEFKQTFTVGFNFWQRYSILIYFIIGISIVFILAFILKLIKNKKMVYKKHHR